MPVLLDTGALLASADRRDRWHGPMKSFLESAPELLIAPASVIPETCYLVGRNLGPEAEMAILDGIKEGWFRVEPLVETDYARARQVLDQYRNLRLGFVDASVVAVAERLAVTKIATTDRRDFSLVRPSHCERFELLP